jgi:Ca2+:H+ antiporter
MKNAGKKVGGGMLREELPLWAGASFCGLLALAGSAWFQAPFTPVVAALLFASLFSVMLWLSFSVVRHAECLAEKLGEPFGTLILTLSVISIEVVMISALMLTGKDDPTLARDTMFSVLMIVLNGMLGVTLLIGGLRHHRQVFNLEGARSYLTVILCLAFLCLILPRFTLNAEGGSASPLLAAFLVFASLVLYGVFLFLQSTTLKGFFLHPGADPSENDHTHGPHDHHSARYHAVFLVLTLLPIVLLSKKIAIILDYGTSVMNAPQALAGFVVALLVLAPEGLAACRAAWNNTLQRTVNITLGSALATIGLTVPAVLVISGCTGQFIEMGLPLTQVVLLVATFFVSSTVFAGNRTNVLAGAVHLVLFAAYVVLIFD